MCAVRRRDMDVASANMSYVKNKVFLWLLSLHQQRK
jgi:hypothetical protein